MSVPIWLWPLAAIVLGLGHIASEYRGPVMLRYVLKPAAIVSLIVLVLTAGAAAPPDYRHLVTTALLLSLVGDVLLIDRRRFLAGLCAFLVAHLLYIAAFATRLDATPALTPLLPLALFGGGVFLLLRSGLGKLALPVAVYIGVILAMAWLAIAVALADGGQSARLAAIGALVFALSDTVLAMDRFGRPFRLAQVVILATYYAAQILLALSVVVLANA